MIPITDIRAWGNVVPWKNDEQVELDLVISRSLVEIYSDKYLAENLAFRGGTALHKLFLSPQPRFSEDIDLVFDRSYFNYDGELSRNKVKKLRREAGAYIRETLSADLENKLKKSGLSDIKLHPLIQEASDADPVQIEIQYPNVIKYPVYVEPRVLLEISCSSLVEPSATKSISSLLDDHYPQADFALESIKIPSVVPERTFLEKLFLLHEEFQRPREKIRVDKLSRHYYDLFQLLKSGHGILAIENPELYETIVKHRYNFNRIGGVNYNLHQPQTLNPTPIPDLLNKWEDDYKTMQEEMIYGECD